MDIMSVVDGLIFNVVSLPHVASHSIHPSYHKNAVSRSCALAFALNVRPHSDAGPSRTCTSFFHFHLSSFHSVCLKRHTAEVRYPEALLSASVLNVLPQQCGRHPALRCGTFSHSHVILSLPLFLFSQRPL